MSGPFDCNNQLSLVFRTGAGNSFRNYFTLLVDTSMNSFLVFVIDIYIFGVTEPTSSFLSDLCCISINISSFIFKSSHCLYPFFIFFVVIKKRLFQIIDYRVDEIYNFCFFHWNHFFRFKCFFIELDSQKTEYILI